MGGYTPNPSARVGGPGRNAKSLNKMWHVSLLPRQLGPSNPAATRARPSESQGKGCQDGQRLDRLGACPRLQECRCRVPRDGDSAATTAPSGGTHKAEEA